MVVLTEEQTMIRDMAQSWVANEQPVTEFRKLRDSGADAGYKPETYAEMVNMGWSGVIVPEEFGGSGMGYLSMGLILEQLGHNLVASPLALSALGAASALLLGGTQEQKAAWLPGIVAGDVIGTLAVDDGPVHNLAAITTRASRDGDGWVLDGVKKFVPESATATLFVAVARTDQGLALFLVPRDTDGLSIEARHLADSRSHGEVTFTGVKLQADALLGSEDGGVLIDQVLDRMRVGYAAEMLGMCDKAFNETLEYLKTREQFDRPLATFQALQHRMANLYTELEMLRSVVEQAMAVLDSGDEAKIAKQSTLAKCFANDTLNLMTREMLQLHGGIGMTDEHDAGFYLKRARVLEIAFGNSSAMADRYGQIACGI